MTKSFNTTSNSQFDYFTVNIVKSLDYLPFGQVMPNRHSQQNYDFGFNGKIIDDEVKGEFNSYDFGARMYDPRIGRFFSKDPKEKEYPWQSTYVFAANNPIQLIDLNGEGPSDPVKHTVKKGETLTSISKKCGVSVNDLVKLNNLKDPNKIQIGQVLKINPEVDFSNNPEGGYRNYANSKGVNIETDYIARIGLEFVTGRGKENTIIVGGEALESVKNMESVKDLTYIAYKTLAREDRLKPGETFVGSYSPGSLSSWTKRAVKGEEDIFSPIHILGSFNFTARVNADGKSFTFAIYDSKTLKSAVDNKMGSTLNRPRLKYDPYINMGANTYQRYIWVQNFSSYGNW